MELFKRLSVTLLTLVLLTGCDLVDNLKNEGKQELKHKSSDVVENIKNKISDNNTPTIKNSEEDKNLIDANTNSENYAFINDNKTSLTEKDRQLISQKGSNEFWANYANLDKLGRAGKVTALVTHDSVESHSSKTQQRPSFDYDVHIAGEYKDGVYDRAKQTWKGEISNNKITQLKGYRGYLYNKSHSLAWSLGGDMETHNLTLGTRAQNVGSNKDSEGGGMGYPETQIRNAIYDNPKAKIFYEIIPVYNGNELVPRGSHVRAYSINDDGQTVNLNVWIANKQKGVEINYKNGTHSK
ncbi:DNA/RNA non-specific endonuclease [Staphylococcus warneri]|uniref:DNA/RNA non-specific endonuclease n=1 Tax=Staphylococcus warneri TaxID=1292 RepID=UPI00326050EA